MFKKILIAFLALFWFNPPAVITAQVDVDAVPSPTTETVTEERTIVSDSNLLNPEHEAINFDFQDPMAIEEYGEDDFNLSALFENGEDAFLLSFVLGMAGIGILIGLAILASFILCIVLLARSQKQPLHKDRVYTGFWKRVAIPLTAGWAILIPFVILTPINEHIGIIVPNLVYVGINIYLYFKHGRTIGDYVMQTKLIDAETGQKPSTGQLFGRFFAKILSAIPLGLGFMWAGWDKEKRAWHDTLSNTRYIETKGYHGAFTFFIVAPMVLYVAVIIFGLATSIGVATMHGYNERLQEYEMEQLMNDEEFLKELEMMQMEMAEEAAEETETNE